MQQLVNSCILANLMLAVSSTMPELAAILYAVIWISVANPTAPVTIFSDSKVAIDHACQKTAPTTCIRIVQYIFLLVKKYAAVLFYMITARTISRTSLGWTPIPRFLTFCQRAPNTSDTKS